MQKFLCPPPHRTTIDQDALWAGLQNGTLHIVSSDHAPYRFDITGKLAAGHTAAFLEIANGLLSIETRIPLLFDALAFEGKLGLEAFCNLTFTAAAKFHGLKNKGSIALGKDGDLVI